MYDSKDADEMARYDVYNLIEMQLTSTVYDNVDPVPVNWSLIHFDGQVARLQMFLKDLQEDPDIEIELMDNLEIYFNDAAGLMKSEDGK